MRQNVGIEDWLAYIYHASFVITDSFHGTCFSLIFEKQFICVMNKDRGVSRFNTLISHFALKNFAVTDISEINEFIERNKQVDYDIVNQLIERETNNSVEWLIRAFRMPHGN